MDNYLGVWGNKMLSDVFSTITGTLPLLKISKWDVQVLKPQKIKDKGPGDTIVRAMNNFKATIREIQDTVAGLFQQVDSDYVTIAEFDSFISFNGVQDAQIVQNAVEQGSFRSVNKVKKPTQVIIELAKGGYRNGIEAVLSKLQEYQGTTKEFRVMTPFGNIENLNLIKLEYSYTRDNGANLLVAKLTFQEIRYGVAGLEKLTIENASTPDKVDVMSVGKKALKGII